MNYSRQLFLGCCDLNAQLLVCVIDEEVSDVLSSQIEKRLKWFRNITGVCNHWKMKDLPEGKGPRIIYFTEDASWATNPRITRVVKMDYDRRLYEKIQFIDIPIEIV